MRLKLHSRWICVTSVLSIAYLLVLLFCLANDSLPLTTKRTLDFEKKLPPYVCHALGKIGPLTVSNTLEGFLLHYHNGCRFFEADLHLTSDNELVLFHCSSSKNTSHLSQVLGVDQTGTYKQFMSAHMAGLTQLDLKGLVSLMVKYPDWLLITDVKAPLSVTLPMICKELEKAGLSCTKRVLPQLYNFGDLDVAKALGFKQTILTLYKLTEPSAEDILNFVEKNPEIVAVTFFPNRYPPLKEGLSKLGIKTFTHTIDDPKEVKKYMEDGIYGVYTNELCSVNK
ncbi:hypothetical protein P9112_001658 [Eukaryota sp. TZLM1-RC]